MVEYNKPLPAILEEDKPFWEAAKRGELVAQKCQQCGSFRKELLPSSIVCPNCLSMDYEWTPLKGTGQVYSFVVFHRSFIPAFQEEAPYNVIIAQLDEGPLLMSNIIGCQNEDIRVGMPIQAVFDQVTEDVSLPRFSLK